MIRFFILMLALQASAHAADTVSLGSTSTQEGSWTYDAAIAAIEKGPSWDAKAPRRFPPPACCNAVQLAAQPPLFAE